jgi:uncharacterized SAM-binding protein YcdF (DUF218 family)
VFTAVAVAFLFWVECAYGFLSTSQRYETDVLVVEGWVHDFAIKGAVDEYHSGGYKQILVTGGPVSGTGGYTNDYNTSASVGAERLRTAGLPGSSVRMVPSRVMERDRTYGSAVALRDWFHANDRVPHAINVVTEGPHARRTRLLFQRAFGNESKVGVIPISNPDYDGARWWHYSEGVKDVITETVAYLYAALVFSPSRSQVEEEPTANRDRVDQPETSVCSREGHARI